MEPRLSAETIDVKTFSLRFIFTAPFHVFQTFILYFYNVFYFKNVGKWNAHVIK